MSALYTACPGIPACPLYLSSHAPNVGGCIDGHMAQPCRVQRGEISYEACYDEAVARAASSLTPEQLTQGYMTQERG